MNQRRSLGSLGALSAVLVGCELIYPAQTPDSAVAGDVPLVIANELPVDVCRVRATKREGHLFWSLLEENGYEKPNQGNRLEKGATKEVRVAPAAAMSFSVEACTSYVTSPITLDTTHPTFVRIVGDRPSATPATAPPGYAEKVITMTYVAPSSGRGGSTSSRCLPDGAKRPEATMDFCCHKEYRSGIGQQSAYCGP